MAKMGARRDRMSLGERLCVRKDDGWAGCAFEGGKEVRSSGSREEAGTDLSRLDLTWWSLH